MNRYLSVARFAFLIALLLTVLVVTCVRADSPSVVVLKVKGIINPVMADYLARGIKEAENRNAACIVQLDTPGGLDTAMRDMVQAIVNARVPVIVYVSPSGARAASAGVFITVSAHIAAMAPNTAIGAASPVSLGSEGEQEMSETMQEKVMNDAAAYIRSLAGERGRNVDWAEQAVREAVSATEKEALELKVIDIVSPTLNSLLNDIDGRTVTLLDGSQVTLVTGSASILYLDMTWIEEFLLALSDPNVAFILLGLAGVGLWVEITNPGLVFPGVFGGISLIFSLFSLGNLPVNTAGVLLMALAFILFAVEALVVPGFGAAGIGGIISLVFGALILFKGGPMFQVEPWVIAIVAICVAAFMAFIIYKLVKTRELKSQTGAEELIGETASVRVTLDPEGVVYYRGELWTAVSEEGRIEVGETVAIKKVIGLKLTVSKMKKEENK
ncbi:MAG: nodulation protein NfeD [Dehalococcoidales bacterium]|nr:nodulation protein NfeD [Dehalococcoidales bacterium]